MADRTRDPLWAFIDEHVTSFSKWDLLAYFASRPEPPQTPHALAERLARREADIQAACEELAHGGILTKTQGIIGASYSLTPDPRMRRLVESFAVSTRARDTRLQVLAHLLKAGAR